jgi:hypothetical protein
MDCLNQIDETFNKLLTVGRYAECALQRLRNLCFKELNQNALKKDFTALTN